MCGSLSAGKAVRWSEGSSKNINQYNMERWCFITRVVMRRCRNLKLRREAVTSQQSVGPLEDEVALSFGKAGCHWSLGHSEYGFVSSYETGFSAGGCL